PFGRLAQEIRPAGSTTITYSACDSCWPMNAVYFVRAHDTDGSDDYQFFDELDRPVGSSEKVPLGNDARQETRYNTIGLVAQVSKPYIYTDPVFWTTYLYDAIGRVTSEDAPVSESTPSGATTIYDYRG